MKVINIDGYEDMKKNKLLLEEVIENHGVVVYPTDTLNGIGCSAYDEVAIDKLIKIKRRDNKNMPVLASDMAAVRNVVKFNKNSEILAKRFWPGALTLVVEVSDFLLSDRVIEKETVGIRIPDHDSARLVAGVFGGIVIGTSANISGKSPLNSIEEIKKELPDIDLLITSKIKPKGIRSTVINMETLQIFREGAISEKEIKKVIL